MNYTNAKCFVDTSILLYQHGVNADEKSKIAANLVGELLLHGKLYLSTQVLQEFCYNALKKLGQPSEGVKVVLSDYLNANIVVNDAQSTREAIDISSTHQLSFWDSLIIAAASEARCKYLITEDLNHGQKIHGIKVINPFL